MGSGRFEGDGSSDGSSDGSIADLPWASVFDPEINMRAVTAIQARGFRAASEVVNRLVKAPDEHARVDYQRPEPNKRSGQEVNGLLSLWERLLAQMTQSLNGAGLTPGGAATLDFAKPGVRNEVCLHANTSGAAASEVWLHNGGRDDLGDVRLRCSDLVSHDGRSVDSAVVGFEPDVVPMPALSSRGVRVTVRLAPGVQPSRYRGTLLVDGHPDAWLPVVLDVPPRAS